MPGKKRRDTPVWLPLILLPAGNLLSLFFAPFAIHWRTLALSLLGAATEELFFRRLLLKTVLLPRIRPVSAIVVTATVFAAMHLLHLRSGIPLPYVLSQVACAFCFSIWAGAVVWRKGSIGFPLLAHILLNLTSVTEGKLFPLLVNMVVLADGILLMKENGRE